MGGKVLIVTKNTVVSDKRTLTEAKVLANAGLEVVVLGLLGKGLLPYEVQAGLQIRRVSSVLGLAPAFRDRLWLPLRRLMHLPSIVVVKMLYSTIARGLRWLDRKAKPITVWVRLTKDAFREDADYYHAHFPLSVIFLAQIVAKLKGRRFVADFNDILILEQSHYSSKGYYEQNTLWGAQLDEREQARIEGVLKLIPPEVGSILDVGCGDGRITNRLAAKYPRVVGVDISEEALQHVKAETVKALVESLPFKDRSFDLVLATELLEHLPKAIYHKAIAEMKRVAKEWILISVPWKEQLSIGQARCVRCGVIFHVNYHYRNFNSSSLKRLFFPEFKLVICRQVGGERAYYHPLLLWTKRRVGGIWARTPSTVCPRCGTLLYGSGYPENNVISRFCNEKNGRIRKHRRPEKSHVIALYRRVVSL
jgi:SAM-dependent methyltransferase